MDEDTSLEDSMLRSRSVFQPIAAVIWTLVLPSTVAAELTTDGMRVLSQAAADIAGMAEDDDRFGEVLASGDFDGDGFDDLVVGIPFEDVGAQEDAGAVFVIYGSPTGVSSSRDVLLTADSSGVPGLAEQGDRMGGALAVGDFNGDNRDDLAVGVPFEDVGGKVEVGAVVVLMGSGTGLQTVDSQLWTEDLLVNTEDVWPFSRMGQSLAAGDFNGDGRDDLAIGLPGDTVLSQAGAGSVVVLYGSVGGLTAANHDRFSGVDLGEVSANAAFGAALAAGHFISDPVVPTSYCDLMIALPGIDYGQEAGFVGAFPGSPSGITIDFGNLWARAPISINPSQLSWTIAVGDTTGDGEVESVAMGVIDYDFPVVDAGHVSFLTWGSRTDLFLGEVATPQVSAAMGGGLAIADFDGDGIDDLLVGAPGLGAAGEPQGSGSVFFLPGSQDVGPDLPGLQSWRLGDLGYAPSVSDDHLGAALVAGDFNGDGLEDAAFGIPGRDLGDASRAGLVVILPGASSLIFRDGFESGDLLAW
jgi:hypothetical protein